MSGALDIGTLTGTIQLEDGFTSVLKTIEANFTVASSKLEKVGADFTKAGRALTIGFTAPLTLASGAALKFSGDFEASMTRLVSLAGVSGDELAKVKDHILDLAPAVGIGPQALADAMTVVSSTVSDTSVALSILDIAAKGSAAGMGDTKDVAKALTAVINSYGAANITAAEAGDILTQTVKDGGAEAKELAPTLANVVPMAAQLGISFKEVGANIATFTKLGVPATEAVTSLSAVMTALLKTTKQGTDALASVGMTYASLRAEIQQKGLAASMLDLTERFGDNKEALTDVFGRVEALRNVMGTAGQQAETYTEVLGHMSEAAGTLDGAFAKMKGTQVQTWNEFKAQVDVIAIKLGDQLAPAFHKLLMNVQPILDAVVKAIKRFSELPAPVQTTAIAIAAAAAAAGPLLMAIGGMASGIAALAPLVGPLGVAIGALSGPVGLVAIAIIGVTTAIWKFKNSVQDLEDKGKHIGEPLKGLKDGMGNAVLTIDDVQDKLGKLPPLVNGASVSIAGLTKTTDDASGSTTNFALTTDEAREALAAWNAKADAAASSMDTLSGAQIEAIKWYQEQGTSVADIAKILEIYEQQIDQLVDAEKARNAASKEMVEYRLKAQKQQEDALKDLGQATLDNLRLQTTAEQRLVDVSLNSHQQQLADLDRWVAAEKAKLDTRAANYEQAAKAIEDAAKAEREELERLQAIADQQGSWQFVGPEIPDSAKADKLGDALDKVSDAFGNLGAIGGDSISKLTRVVGTLISTFQTMRTMLQSMAGSGGGGATPGGLNAATFMMTAGFMGIKYLGDQQQAAENLRTTIVGMWMDAGRALGDYSKAANAIVGQATIDRYRELIRHAQTLEEAQQHYNDLLHAMDDAQQLVDDVQSAVGSSQTQRLADVEKAKRILDYVEAAQRRYKDGTTSEPEFTAEQQAKAYYNWQKAMAEAGNAAAQAWVDAADAAEKGITKSSAVMDALQKEYDSLANSVANEAPEEVMGVIESATRGQMDALKKQMDEQRQALAAQTEATAADAGAAAATETERQKKHVLDAAGEMAAGIEDALNNIQPNVIHIRADWVVDPFPGAGSGPGYHNEGTVVPFTPKGSDIYPAMLSAGERVLSPKENKAFEAGIVLASRGKAENGGGSSEMAATIVGLRADINHALPAALKRAVRDAMMEARVVA